MKYNLKITACAALLMAASAVQAGESWFTDFEGPEARPKGTFDSLSFTSGAFIVDSNPVDKFLQMGGSSTATFTLSATAVAIPAFLIEFAATTSGGQSSDVVLNFAKVGTSFSQTVTLAPTVAVSGNPGWMSVGIDLTRYFMNSGLGGSTAGTWKLTFDNAPQAAGYRVDDLRVSAVPEPEGLVLAFASLGILAGIKRRVSAKSA